MRMDSMMRSTHFYAKHADSKDCIIVLTRLTTKGQPNGKEMVRVSGTTVTCEWGMAEKTQRQRSVNYFGSEQSAMRFASEKVWSKQDRGYGLVYTV